MGQISKIRTKIRFQDFSKRFETVNKVETYTSDESYMPYKEEEDF